MRYTVLVIFALLLAAPAARVQEPQQEPQPPAKEGEPAEPVEPPFVIPPEEKARKNPVNPTAMSLDQGKRLYATQCAMCHGADGSGKGELAETMQLNLRDYRDPKSLAEVTDGELFYITKVGKGKMPGQEGRMRDRQIWHLINYIRSFSKKEAPPGKGPATENPPH